MGATGITKGGYEGAVTHGTYRGVGCSWDGCERPAKAKGMCMSHYNKARWSAGLRSPSNNAESARAVRLRQRYGITVEEYFRLLEEQGGRCAVCRGLPEEVNKPKHWTDVLCVDHCHDTGVVRGLLCNDCNLVVARAHTSDILRRAVEYLGRFD